MLLRLFQMYTVINLCFVIAHRAMPEWAQDIIRASTLLILVTVVSFWCSGNISSIYIDLFDSFFKTTLSDTTKILIIAMIDIIIHIVPLLIMGMPHTPSSFIWAYGIMLVWYITVRNHIDKIYVPGVHSDRSMIVAGLVAVIAYKGMLSI
jgi:hypothetical protein